MGVPKSVLIPVDRVADFDFFLAVGTGTFGYIYSLEKRTILKTLRWHSYLAKNFALAAGPYFSIA